MVIVSSLYPNVIKVCRPLIIEDEVLKMISKKFYESLSKSLIEEFSQSSPIQCNLTHVTDFPTGTEKGTFMGLQFSGRIFRIVHVSLNGSRSYTTISKLYEFPEMKPSGGIMKTAEYVAKCVNNFLITYGIRGNKVILGVACSFPMEQDSLQNGTITQWNKEFENNEKNQNFFLHLKVALKKYSNTKKMYLISLISNGTASLLSGLYKDPYLRIGFYIGESTNITYIEKYENMTTFKGDGLRSRTAIDVKIKSFGDDGSLDFIRTKYDFAIDSASENPGKNIFEKLISEEYLGEVARLYLHELASLGLILNGYVTANLKTKDSLKAADLAIMEMDDEKSFLRCKSVMLGLGYPKVTDSDCVQIRFACRSVLRRSINLLAACLTAIIHKMKSNNVHLIGDGMLLRDYLDYENYLVKKISQLKKPSVKFQLIKGEREDVAAGAGLCAHIYRDVFIKLEDKQRALPRFNADKYNLIDLPASCIDCECEPSDSWLASKKKITKKPSNPEKPEVLSLSITSQESKNLIEPLFSNPSRCLQFN